MQCVVRQRLKTIRRIFIRALHPCSGRNALHRPQHHSRHHRVRHAELKRQSAHFVAMPSGWSAPPPRLSRHSTVTTTFANERLLRSFMSVAAWRRRALPWEMRPSTCVEESRARREKGAACESLY